MLFFQPMKKEIDTRFFRAGVGTVIYNQNSEVVLFKRAQYPIGVWQFQQGGIDLGEHPEQTLWRELKEEVGLEQTDFLQVIEYPRWTVYQDNNTVLDSSKSRFGQAHRWYFLELKESVTIDLTKASENEASDYKWVPFPLAVAETEELKKHVYQELMTHFHSDIFIN